jgi:hypothetical protein
MAFHIIIIDKKPFKCVECSCITFKKISTPAGEPEGDYYECAECGTVYEKI